MVTWARRWQVVKIWMTGVDDRLNVVVVGGGGSRGEGGRMRDIDR